MARSRKNPFTRKALARVSSTVQRREDPNWKGHLYRNGSVWSMGQLSKEDIKQLDAEVKAGRAVKGKAMWPYFTHGSAQKTVWAAKGTPEAAYLSRKRDS